MNIPIKIYNTKDIKIFYKKRSLAPVLKTWNSINVSIGIKLIRQK
jgi:hypothetical protein